MTAGPMNSRNQIAAFVLFLFTGEVIAGEIIAGEVNAYDVETDQRRWTFRTNGPVRCAPAI
jgi:hypothetical protein